MRSVKPILGLMLAFMLTGCASLMMSVKDNEGSVASVMLKRGDSVTLETPTWDAALAPKLTKAKYTKESFEKLITTSVTDALGRRGVTIAASAKDATGRVSVHLSEYHYGSGAARFFLAGTGFGDSKLGGSITIETPAGKREMEVRKRGAKSGLGTWGDQTPENVSYFANAAAAKIVQ